VDLLAALGEDGRNEDDEDEWEAALVNLAKSYCEAGDHLRSLDLYAQAEAKCREFLTLTIEKESLILNNKGAVLVHLNRFEEALQLFRAAHALRVGKYGEESLMTYNSLENVASMRLRLRTAIGESIRDYERVFRFKERKFGVGSREAIRTKSNLAFALLEAGRY
jgi:tetratricopeptide (TPR) repeat protein